MQDERICVQSIYEIGFPDSGLGEVRVTWVSCQTVWGTLRHGGGGEIDYILIIENLSDLTKWSKAKAVII